MSIFIRITVGILIGLILCLVLARQNKDYSLLLSLLICCVAISGSVLYLEPVIRFVDKIKTVGTLDSATFSVLLKATGIGVISEIASLICKDAGNDALGKTLQFVAVAVMLYLSLPMLTSLVDLLNTLLGSL